MDKIEYQSLEECPWQQLDTKEHLFIAKCFKKECTLEVLCSDFKSTWYEKLDANAIADRNNRLNPSIETSVDRLLHHVISILNNKTATKETFSLCVVLLSDEELKIASELQLCGLPFSWEFNLARRDDDLLSKQLVKPLISMVLEMSRRQKKLLKIMKHKDDQIADYKTEGCRILKKHKHQEPFQEQRFEDDMKQSEEFQSIAVMSKGAILNPELQHLYTSIMSAQTSHDLNKNKAISTDKKSNTRMKKTTADTVTISNKELELQRRLALQNRLALERTKKEIQSKSKKLKL